MGNSSLFLFIILFKTMYIVCLRTQAGTVFNCVIPRVGSVTQPLTTSTSFPGDPSASLWDEGLEHDIPCVVGFCGSYSQPCGRGIYANAPEPLGSCSTYLSAYRAREGGLASAALPPSSFAAQMACVAMFKCFSDSSLSRMPPLF